MAPPVPLLIVGVGHVFRIGDAIQSLIAQEAPQVVALELDAQRYQGLLARQQGAAPAAQDLKRAPRVYRALAKFQESVAESYGVEVGSEMLAAVQAAGRVGARVALVDRPAEEAVRRLWREMTWREKGRLLWSSLVARFAPGRAANVESEIQRYQTDPAKYLEELGREFPAVKRVLLDERNQFMAAHLRSLARESKTLALVGDGHVDGLLQLLDDLKPRAVRLAELRAFLPPSGVRWSLAGDARSVGFSFDQQSLEGSLGRP